MGQRHSHLWPEGAGIRPYGAYSRGIRRIPRLLGALPAGINSNI